MRILFAGGGTAGHVNPALAIANYIMEKEKCEIEFVGTPEGIEAELIPRLGFDISLIKIHGFERKINLQNFKNIFELPKSISDSKKIIKRFKPDIAIGTGGYVAGPVLYAAAKMGIPTLVHEANAYPGVTIKILAKYVDTVALGAKAAEKFIKNPKNVIYTGNPVRPSILSTPEFDARRTLKLDKRPFIVIFGGSMGARDFNKTVVDWISNIAKTQKYQIMMATGKFNQYDAVMERFDSNSCNLKAYPSINVNEYIYDMDIVMAAADLVISRAGASTLAELTALGKPAILVPSPNVTANHQEHNARAVENEGGAKVIIEKDFSPDTLKNCVEELVENKDKLVKMRKAAKNIGTENATHDIYKEAKRLIESYHQDNK